MSSKLRQKNYTIWVVIGIISFLIFLGIKSNQPSANLALDGKTAVIYRSATCGCCKQYIAYLRQAGLTIDEKVSDGDDAGLTPIKDQFKIPAKVRSCHTMRIGDYTVEGHVPVEAIQKLLTEKPNISGIALPGMPAGSPGMSGVKFGTFNIVSFTADGSVSPYMSL